MTNAVIEVMTEASKQILRDEYNPFEEQIGEVIPSNMEFEWVLFSEKGGHSFKIYLQNFLAHIALLRDQLLIAKFVVPKPLIRICGYKP